MSPAGQPSTITVGVATADLSTNAAVSSFLLVPQEPSYDLSASKEETKNNAGEEDEEEKKKDESDSLQIIQGFSNDLTELDSARLENAIEDSES